MQAVVVNLQADISNLTQIKSSPESFRSEENKSSKSFEDMVHEAKSELSNEKKETSVKEKAEKTEVSEKSSEKVSEKLSEKSENEISKTSEKEKSHNPQAVKTEESSEKLLSKNQKEIKTAKKISKSEKKADDSEKKVNLENIDAAQKKNISENADNLELIHAEIKNLPDEELVAASSGLQNSEIPEILNTAEQSIFNSEFLDEVSDISAEASGVKPKVFAFAKDGKITVKDFRTEGNQKNNEKNPAELKISDVKFDGKNNVEMTMDVALNVQQNISSLTNQAAGADGSDFQAMLTNQIQQNAGEIVKAGNIVLKDNDKGQIKLILHPEKLGNVRIDLNLNDKNISGRIIVSSQEAFNAFKETAESLKQAFIESGFESAGLELSMAGQNFNGNNAQGNEKSPLVFEIARAYGEGDVQTEGTFETEEILSNSLLNSVNIVA